MTNDVEEILEGVLTALTRSEGQPDRLFHLLHETWPQARTTALIGGLLSAERALSSMFRHGESKAREGQLALAAALALAEASNDAEMTLPGRFVRLSDILAA